MMIRVGDELVILLRRHDDGAYSIADTEQMKTTLGGVLPDVGDKLTTLYDDGYSFSIEIIDRHRILEADRFEYYWVLLYKELDDSEELERRMAPLKEMVRLKKARDAKASKKPPAKKAHTTSGKKPSKAKLAPKPKV
jgi:transcription initiation factor IIE alpha subunit